MRMNANGRKGEHFYGYDEHFWDCISTSFEGEILSRILF